MRQSEGLGRYHCGVGNHLLPRAIKRKQLPMGYGRRTPLRIFKSSKRSRPLDSMSRPQAPENGLEALALPDAIGTKARGAKTPAAANEFRVGPLCPRCRVVSAGKGRFG